jgi:hypothetical protein
MLGINSIFEMVWGQVLRIRTKPSIEFWDEAISTVKDKHHDFLFMAEAYWGTEGQLRDLGFDYCYDKTLYDRLKYSTPLEISDYLRCTADYVDRGVHFIENHDEERAAITFGRDKSLAAAVAVSTLPGIRLFHDGQMDGKWSHIPVQMAREPYQPVDEVVHDLYDMLLRSCQDGIFHQGEWTFREVEPGWQGSQTFHNLLAWSWKLGDKLKLAVINYSSHESQGRVKLALDFEGKETVTTFDELANMPYQSEVEEVEKLGLYIDLKPWQAHILDITLS